MKVEMANCYGMMQLMAELGCYDCIEAEPDCLTLMAEAGMGKFRMIPSATATAVNRGGDMEKPIEPTLENYEEFYDLPTLEEDENLVSAESHAAEEFRTFRKHDDAEELVGTYTEA